MTTLELHLPDEVAERLEKLASERGISVVTLIESALEEKLARQGEFESAARHVLVKNVELYKRLA
jgi:predicted transcriptional regulator